MRGSPCLVASSSRRATTSDSQSRNVSVFVGPPNENSPVKTGSVGLSRLREHDGDVPRTQQRREIHRVSDYQVELVSGARWSLARVQDRHGSFEDLESAWHELTE